MNPISACGVPSGLIAHHVHDVADPDEFPVLAQGTVIGFMVHARL